MTGCRDCQIGDFVRALRIGEVLAAVTAVPVFLNSVLCAACRFFCVIAHVLMAGYRNLFRLGVSIGLALILSRCSVGADTRCGTAGLRGHCTGNGDSVAAERHDLRAAFACAGDLHLCAFHAVPGPGAFLCPCMTECRTGNHRILLCVSLIGCFIQIMCRIRTGGVKMSDLRRGQCLLTHLAALIALTHNNRLCRNDTGIGNRPLNALQLIIVVEFLDRLILLCRVGKDYAFFIRPLRSIVASSALRACCSRIINKCDLRRMRCRVIFRFAVHNPLERQRAGEAVTGLCPFAPFPRMPCALILSCLRVIDICRQQRSINIVHVRAVAFSQKLVQNIINVNIATVFILDVLHTVIEKFAGQIQLAEFTATRHSPPDMINCLMPSPVSLADIGTIQHGKINRSQRGAAFEHIVNIVNITGTYKAAEINLPQLSKAFKHGFDVVYIGSINRFLNLECFQICKVCKQCLTALRQLCSVRDYNILHIFRIQIVRVKQSTDVNSVRLFKIQRIILVLPDYTSRIGNAACNRQRLCLCIPLKTGIQRTVLQICSLSIDGLRCQRNPDLCRGNQIDRDSQDS